MTPARIDPWRRVRSQMDAYSAQGLFSPRRVGGVLPITTVTLRSNGSTVGLT